MTVANIRSSGSSLVRQTVAGSVTFVSGGTTGTVLIDGHAVVDGNTGGSSGSFNASFQDLLTSANSPFDFDGDINLTWNFSGGNEGTWYVQSVTNVSGFSSTSRMSGTYSYTINSDGSQMTFTMNYSKIEATVAGFTTTINITNQANPAYPKSVSVTATQTGPSTGTYQYTLTMTDGTQTTMSGNYTPSAPLGLPTGL